MFLNSDVDGTSSNEYLVVNTLQAQELQYNTDNSYRPSEMQNDKTSKRCSTYIPQYLGD